MDAQKYGHTTGTNVEKPFHDFNYFSSHCLQPNGQIHLQSTFFPLVVSSIDNIIYPSDKTFIFSASRHEPSGPH